MLTINSFHYSRNKVAELSKKFLDRPFKPLDTAIYWIEYIARHGKGALRSPLVDMPWWQANLLDVYAFILAVAIAALYTVKLIVKFICKVCGCMGKRKLASGETKKKYQ